jgi:ATP/maltotriose-dependent transcriptional regulator MalT
LSETLENQLAICLLLTNQNADARGRMKLTPWLADALGNPRLLARAFMMRAQLLGHRLELRSAAREYERAAQFALEARAWDIATRALHRAATQHLQLGNLKKGLRFSDKALHAAKRWRDLATLVEIHSVRALIFKMQGDWASAREALSEGSKILEHLGQAPAEAFYLISFNWYIRLWKAYPQQLVVLEY